MRKTIAKVLGLVLAAAMMVSCVCVSAFAAGSVDFFTKTLKFATAVGDAAQQPIKQLTTVNNFGASLMNVGAKGLNLGTTALLETPTKALNLGTAVKNGATASIKLGTAAGNAGKTGLDVTTSGVKLGSAVNSGVKNGVASGLGVANSGLKVFNTVADALNPLSTINTGLSLVNGGIDLYQNVQELKSSKDSENAPAEDPQVAEEVTTPAVDA
jgi:hypothetical protein